MGTCAQGFGQMRGTQKACEEALYPLHRGGSEAPTWSRVPVARPRMAIAAPSSSAAPPFTNSDGSGARGPSRVNARPADPRRPRPTGPWSPEHGAPAQCLQPGPGCRRCDAEGAASTEVRDGTSELEFSVKQRRQYCFAQRRETVVTCPETQCVPTPGAVSEDLLGSREELGPGRVCPALFFNLASLASWQSWFQLVLNTPFRILPPATPPLRSSTSQPGLLTSKDLIQ